MLDGLLGDPELPAIVSVATHNDGTWTNADLLDKVAAVKHMLDAYGVPEGECVPALLTTQPASVAVLIACAVSHRPLAPLGPRMTENE